MKRKDKEQMISMGKQRVRIEEKEKDEETLQNQKQFAQDNVSLEMVISYIFHLT